MKSLAFLCNIRRDSKAVMHRIANPCRSVRLRLAPPVSRGSSSVGRAIPCQGIGREFETLLPLQIKKGKVLFALSLFSFPDHEGIIATLSPDGEIGRHKRLKISRPYGRTGSIPVPGTM